MNDQGSLVDLYEVGERGAVLVRPDGHAAWRTLDSGHDAAEELTSPWARMRRPFAAPRSR